MVPATREADLDDVEDHVICFRERAKLRLTLEGPSLRGKTGPEGKEHVDEIRFLTDGTVGLGLLPEVLCHPQQLRLRVTGVESGDLAASHTPHRRVAGEAVLDLAKPGRGGRVKRGLGRAFHRQLR